MGNFSSLSDEQLVNILKENERNSSKALIELENRHSGIYYKIINKFIPSKEANSAISLDKDFLFGNKKYLIYECALKFDPNKNTKFSTFFGNNARFFCLNYINKGQKFINFDHSDFENIFESEEKDSIKEQIDSNIVDEIFDLLSKQEDDRLLQIFKLRYFSSKDGKITPWNQIHTKINHKYNKSGHVTMQACINIHKKGIEIIKDYLKKRDG